jgi:hypothetical protein
MESISFTVSEITDIVSGEDWKGAFARLFPERASTLKSEIFDDAVIEAAGQGWSLDMHIFEEDELNG